MKWLSTRCGKNLQKPSPSPDRHRTKSAEPSIEPGQHLPSTARSPAANALCIVIASPEPGISPALVVQAPQKARPVLNFEPGRAAGPELCISSSKSFFFTFRQPFIQPEMQPDGRQHDRPTPVTRERYGVKKTFFSSAQAHQLNFGSPPGQ